MTRSIAFSPILLTLTFLRQKREETKRLAHIAPVDLGMPVIAAPR